MVITPFFFFSGATAVDQLPQGFAGTISYPPFYAFAGFVPSGTVVAQAETPAVGGGKSRRRRSFVELDGQLVEVSGYEEAERLLTELKKEEKAQEKARKKLRISLGKVQDSPVGLYAEQKKIEALERQMDDRADRIAQLYILIQNCLEEEDEADEEEVLLMS